MYANSAVLEAAGARAGRLSFVIGDAVRVRPGTPDPDFPDSQLDGWVGKIADWNEMLTPTQYLVEWDESTLQRMPPECRDLCEREDFALNRMWLVEDDLDLLPT